MTPELLEASAWATITHEWIIRWLLIITLGGVMPVLGRLIPSFLFWAWFDSVKRVSALAACCLCIYSGYLVADTVALDHEGVSALKQHQTQDGVEYRLPFTGTLVVLKSATR